jgi:hypothetical protein
MDLESFCHALENQALSVQTPHENIISIVVVAMTGLALLIPLQILATGIVGLGAASCAAPLKAQPQPRAFL